MPRGIVAYRMERGDTLDSVANMFSTTVANIRAMNQLPADKEMKEGDEVYVPTVGAVSVN
jgi:spore germination protein YaaH